MKIILELEVDEITGNAYKECSLEHKKQFNGDVSEMLQNIIGNRRSAHIKRLLEEIRNDAGVASEFNPEILYELLRAEDDAA